MWGLNLLNKLELTDLSTLLCLISTNTISHSSWAQSPLDGLEVRVFAKWGPVAAKGRFRITNCAVYHTLSLCTIPKATLLMQMSIINLAKNLP